MDFMHVTQNIEVETKQPSLEFEEEARQKFSSFYEEPEEVDDQTEEMPIIDGPYSTPLTPPLVPPSQIAKIVTALPVELRPFVEPLPNAIETAFKSGVMQTKMVISLTTDELVEVIIDQYDTAPNAFHISFYGSEQTGNLISLKQNELLTSLQKTLPHFSFAISPPFVTPPAFSLPKSRRFGYSPVNRGKSKK